MGEPSDTAAVILAAGKGTRMGSDKAKVLHFLRGRPLVTYPLDAARAAGATRVVIVTGHQRDAVEAAVSAHTTHNGERATWLRFAVQEEQLGTGHAVLCALAEIPRDCESVLILSGDTPMLTAPTLRALASAAAASSGSMALCTFSPTDRTGYGRVVRDAEGRVVRIVEERDATAAELELVECNAGIYCVSAACLHDELPSLGRDNAQSEVYLTDLVELRARHGDVAVLDVSAVEAAGVNTAAQLAALETEA